MFILRCGHILEARKMEVVPVFSGQCSKGVAFSPETRFVLFTYLCFFPIVLNLDPPVTRFAVLDIDAENAFTALTFVFLLLLKRDAFCSISQE